MTARDLDAVLAIEVGAYSFPWTRGNFIDSLAVGYHAQVLCDDAGSVQGYLVAMPGVDEMHLLNLTVAPDRQGQGLAGHMLDALEAYCCGHAMPTLWLEVRAGNERARRLYLRRGFTEVGWRKGYYPAAFSRREDAVVMRATLCCGGPNGLD